MRILVTGGGGFLGSHLVERLEREGHDVFVARRRDYDLTRWEDGERLFRAARPERARRDGHLQRRAVGRDVVQDRVEVEARVQADGRAGGRGGEQVQQPEDVRRRRGDLQAVIRGQLQAVPPVPDRGGESRAQSVHAEQQSGSLLRMDRGSSKTIESRLLLLFVQRH